MENTVQRNHPLVATHEFATVEDYVIFLMHQKAYEIASSLCNGCSALDWGCNNGYGLPILAKSAQLVGGVDTNEACVDEARRLHPEFAGNIWLYDGQNIPVPEESWDLVVSFQVIEHVKNVADYVQSIIRVMRNTGVVIFTTPNRLIRLDEGMKPWNEFHETEYTPNGLKTALRQFFPSVEIYGLQGDAEITGIERSRCARAREMARRNRASEQKVLQSLRNSVKTTIKAMLPSGAATRIRRGLRGDSSKIGSPHLPDSVLQRFSTSKIHYTQLEIDSALDLMAVCSNKKIEFATTLR